METLTQLLFLTMVCIVVLTYHGSKPRLILLHRLLYLETLEHSTIYIQQSLTLALDFNLWSTRFNDTRLLTSRKLIFVLYYSAMAL